jgi:alpha-beta hydrolase superfamily lysophospholipase
MAVERFKVKGRKDIELACIKMEPKKKPKAILHIFHGMGEHKERYIPFMEFMSLNGYIVVAHDHPLHGESIRKEEGYGLFLRNDHWDDVIDACYQVGRQVMKDHPGLKIIVLGHSMGSVIARAFLSKNPLIPSAAIIMGTLPVYTTMKGFAPLTLAKTVRLFSKKEQRSTFIAGILNKPLIAPYENPRSPFDWITSDESIVDTYVEDPLCGYAYTPQFYVEFIRSIVQINKVSFLKRTKNIPLLFISGDADPVGENGDGVKQVVKLYEDNGYDKITLQLMENMRHEVLNEVRKQETFDYILSWCDGIV